MNSGVYQIKNIVTGSAYYGRTIDWAARRRRHLCDLRAGRHTNPKLQSSWNARTEDQFEFSLVWPSEPETLEELESFVLDVTFDSGTLYNAHKNSVGGFLGQKHSEETKLKWSQQRKGRKMASISKERQAKTRESSSSWAAHQAWMQTPEVMKSRAKLAADPEVRARAVATRSANGYKPFSDEVRQKQKDEARVRVFAGLSWATENQKTRSQAIEKFTFSWGGLKKYQPEWEALNGPLNLPKRAAGTRWHERTH